MSELREEWRGGAVAGRTHFRDEAKLPARSFWGADARVRLMAALPVGLYLLAAGLVLFRLGSHPPFTYNWENNTAEGLFTFLDRPSFDIFHLTEGLMTDSGATPLVVLPAWLGFALGGASVVSMRWPVALIAAGAVPLLRLVGRRMVGNRVGLLAALLLAMSPVFLLYARTATDVGISLVPVLLTIYVLLRVLERPGRWWWVVALQGTLLLGAYCYAPARFLWLFSVGLLVLEAFMRRGDKPRETQRLLASAALTAVAMCGTITALDYEHDHDFAISVAYYYSGRGEQVANLLVNTAIYAHTTAPADGKTPSSLELLGQLVGQNSANLADLLLDQDTMPAITDFWNPHGRLLPLMLVPFFLLGLVMAARRACRRDAYRYRLLVLFFAGFTVPMIFTSQVHIGRLIFALPLLCLLIAVGVIDLPLAYQSIVSFGTRNVPRTAVWALSKMKLSERGRRVASSVSVMALLVLVGVSGWQDYSIELPPSTQARIADLLLADAPAIHKEDGRVALVAEDDPTLALENIDSSLYRLDLQGYYCFYNLSNGQGAPCGSGDAKSTLMVGALLARMQDPATVPGYCTNVYYVAPALLPRFLQAMSRHSSLCPQPLRYKLLPN